MMRNGRELRISRPFRLQARVLGLTSGNEICVNLHRLTRNASLTSVTVDPSDGG